MYVVGRRGLISPATDDCLSTREALGRLGAADNMAMQILFILITADAYRYRCLFSLFRRIAE